MTLPVRPSGSLQFNRLDAGNVAVWGIVATVMTYAGPPVVAWLDAQGGWISLLIVPAVVAAGRAVVRWVSDNSAG